MLEEPPVVKRPRTEIVDRIEKLEKGAEGRVKDLREKVRTLCLQSSPSDPLILLTLDELATQARKLRDGEADTLEELARQANRFQHKINIPNLCMSVLGGKAADVISKAMSKCLKEEKPEKTAKEEQKRAPSPLSNVYPQQMYMYPPFPNQGYSNQGYHFQGYPNHGYSGVYPSPGGYRGRGRSRPRGNCHLCNSPSHFMKDCGKVKEERK